MALRAEPVGDVVCELGESPLWLPEPGQLAWLDITGLLLHRVTAAGEAVAPVALSEMVTAVGLGAGDECVVATRTGVGRLELEAGAVRAVGDAVVTAAGARMNDGAVAPDGSFWAGSYVPEAGTGALWRWEPGAPARRQLDGVTVSNGLDWRPGDEREMLYVDSAAGGVDVLRLDDAGDVAARERLADVDEDDGVPDGLCIDADGTAWVAIWGAGEVRAYDRAGRVQEVVEVAARQPSSCAFGGRDGRTLYITSALEDLADPGPADGRLHACELPVAGQPARRAG